MMAMVMKMEQVTQRFGINISVRKSGVFCSSVEVKEISGWGLAVERSANEAGERVYLTRKCDNERWKIPAGH